MSRFARRRESPDWGAPPIVIGATSPAVAAATRFVTGSAAKVAAVAKPLGGGFAVSAPIAKPKAASPVPKVSVVAKVSAPKVSAPVVAKPAASVKVSPPKVSAVPPKVSAPKVASTAQQGNFLDAGSAPLAASTVKVPAGTHVLTQAERDANARAQQKAEALKLAERNAAYASSRAADQKLEQQTHAWLMAKDPAYAAREKYIHTAGLDVNQLVMGAKVIAIGASVIASGGAAAGAVGLTAAGGSLAAAAAADRIVAAVEKGGELANKAKSIVNDAKAAAAKGDAVAREVVATVERVSADRKEQAVPAGAVRALNAVGEQAFAAAASATPPPASSFAITAPLQVRPPAAVATRPPAGADFLSRIDLPTVRPRWLVTDAAKVVDLDKTPGSATLRGFVVWSSGKVVRQ